MDIGMLECLPGAPGCSFFGSLKFEKHTLPKKGPDLKKHGISLYPMLLAQKSVPLIFGPPIISRKNLKNVSKSDPKTNSTKSVTSFSSWVKKARKNGPSESPGGALSGPPGLETHTLDCSDRIKTRIPDTNSCKRSCKRSTQ